MADTIIIEDPELVREIKRQAERTGKRAEDVVADAVRAQHAEPASQEDAELEALLAEIDALPRLGPALTDADLYDEDGLPR